MKPLELDRWLNIHELVDLRPLDIDVIGKRASLDQKGSDDKVSEFEIDVNSLYRVRLLGWGIFGVVKLMKNSEGDLFAVKYFQYRHHISRAMLSESFSRELDALTKLHHSCIIPIYGWSRDMEKEPALVMKYMENGSVYDALESAQAKNPPDFWNPTGIAIIVCGIAAGLEFIHSRGFVH
jgi:serine/threonine protein kinase